MEFPGRLDHPSFATAFGTVLGYLAILSVMTLLLFVVPFVFFVAL